MDEKEIAYNKGRNDVLLLIQNHITEHANLDTERGSVPEWKAGYWTGLNHIYNLCNKLSTQPSQD